MSQEGNEREERNEWALAVWKENGREEEGTIPTCWIVNKFVMWPPGSNAARFMKEIKEPGEKWQKFDLVKIKMKSNNRQECDEYDFTTTGEISPNDESDEEVKRKPKKKVYPGFVTDSESCKEKVDGSGREAEPDVRNENQVVESRKRDITSLLPDPPEKLKERHIQNKRSGSSAPQQQQSTSPSDHKQRSRSPRENTKTRETSPTSQRGSHSFRGGDQIRQIDCKAVVRLHSFLHLMSNAKDLGHPRPVETIQKTENQVKPRREDQILSEGGDQIRQIDCKAVVRLHSFLHLMSNAKDLGHPRPVETIQKTENQVKPRREDQILSEGEDQIRQIDCKAVVRLHSFLHLMSNAKDLGHPRPVETIQKTENQVKPRREDQILSEGGDQIRQIDCKAVVRFHSFLHLMSNAKDLGHQGPVKTIQKTENQRIKSNLL
uniref:Uncharacterized protein LOC111116362 n=1 Tax=Crassostrea virginica TaxID=6565 RepID=A0A8B8C623_CRAVI|nr:uncharacterized protein LOC111116362 [Crassostrea virginica]